MEGFLRRCFSCVHWMLMSSSVCRCWPVIASTLLIAKSIGLSHRGRRDGNVSAPYAHTHVPVPKVYSQQTHTWFNSCPPSRLEDGMKGCRENAWEERMTEEERELERGTDSSIKIHGFFYSLCWKINSVYYEWEERWTAELGADRRGVRGNGELGGGGGADFITGGRGKRGQG